MWLRRPQIADSRKGLSARNLPRLRARSWYFPNGPFRCLVRDISNEARVFHAAGASPRLSHGAAKENEAEWTLMYSH